MGRLSFDIPLLLVDQSSQFPGTETVTQVKGKFLCCRAHTESIPRFQGQKENEETERSSLYHTKTCQGLPGQTQVSSTEIDEHRNSNSKYHVF